MTQLREAGETWDERHSRGERLAIEAELALRDGNTIKAEDLYRQAAIVEEQAVALVQLAARQTRGITAVSAVALWCKACEYTWAEQLAHRYLAEGGLPPFAVIGLQELLRTMPAPGGE